MIKGVNLGEHRRVNLGERRRWDIVFDGIAVELDEQLHFNRYRALTLGSGVYRRLPNFPAAGYATLCRQREAACLRAGSYGGKWSNPSCERQFGPAGPLGDLQGAGAPRWKQRAFYDFLKDLAPLALGLPVARLAIWEPLPGDPGGRLLGACLDDPAPQTGPLVARFVRMRASGAVV